jgi:hypothetical protein
MASPSFILNALVLRWCHLRTVSIYLVLRSSISHRNEMTPKSEYLVRQASTILAEKQSKFSWAANVECHPVVINDLST